MLRLEFLNLDALNALEKAPGARRSSKIALNSAAHSLVRGSNGSASNKTADFQNVALSLVLFLSHGIVLFLGLQDLKRL